MNKVYCRRNAQTHEFFITIGREEYYLFSQPFRSSVDSFYKSGAPIDKALNHGIGRRDHAVHQTMDKIKLHIRYIETEYGIAILKRTIKRNLNAA